MANHRILLNFPHFTEFLKTMKIHASGDRRTDFLFDRIGSGGTGQSCKFPAAGTRFLQRPFSSHPPRACFLSNSLNLRFDFPKNFSNFASLAMELYMQVFFQWRDRVNDPPLTSSSQRIGFTPIPNYLLNKHNMMD